MSKENTIKSLVMLVAIALGVAGILYARVNLGMSQEALSTWLESATGTLALAAAVVWIAVVWLFVSRRVLG